MKITKLYYQRTINTGAYENIKLGVEADINEGEPAMQAMDSLKQFVDDWYKSFSQEQYESWLAKPIGRPTPPPISDVQVDKQMNQEEQLIHGIGTCTDLKVLESYKLLTSKSYKVLAAYNDKRIEIQTLAIQNQNR